ncbi:hypothetical protein [Streptomyces sp. NPDC088358]|uniref:hypothetical protein n=1 Tax=Streptomyces sp. NPDC088358 TaxID=3365857 RepID=UPI003826A966
MCPAEAGKAQCPLKTRTLGRGIQLPLVDPEPSPASSLKVCRQRTITVSPETGAKHWEALEYGGPEWQKIYFRLRNSVEGYDGYAKNPLAEGIEAAGSRHIRGIAAQTIILAFQLAHADRGKIKNWFETLALGGERPRRRRLVESDAEDQNRKDIGGWSAVVEEDGIVFGIPGHDQVGVVAEQVLLLERGLLLAPGSFGAALPGGRRGWAQGAGDGRVGVSVVAFVYVPAGVGDRDEFGAVRAAAVGERGGPVWRPRPGRPPPARSAGCGEGARRRPG